MTFCPTICGCISSNVIYVVSQTFSVVVINFCVALMFSLSYSSFESKISIGSSTITPCFVTTLILLLKMLLHSLSNIGHINCQILSIHQIVTPIPISTLLLSSHFDDDGDSKGEIATNDAMSYTNFLAYLSNSSCAFYYFAKTFFA